MLRHESSPRFFFAFCETQEALPSTRNVHIAKPASNIQKWGILIILLITYMHMQNVRVYVWHLHKKTKLGKASIYNVIPM